MTWIQTASGKAFDLAAPRPEDVDVRDIAHALSHLCRYAGHCREFYSVAEHSALLHDYALWQDRRDLALVALLHDATEAYVVDVPRPLRRLVPAFDAVEDRVREAVEAALGVPTTDPLVGRWDTAITHDEAAQLHLPPPRPWGLPFGALGVTVRNWTPTRARAEWLDRLGRYEEGRRMLAC